MPEDNTQENISLEERVIRSAAAVYRVTDILPDKEPLKWSLRENALQIAEEIETNFRKQSDYRQDLLDHAEEFCYALMSKFFIINGYGFIARMNFDVLQKEYALILDIIKDKRKQLSFMSYKNLLDIPVESGLFKKDIKDTDEVHIATGNKETYRGYEGKEKTNQRAVPMKMTRKKDDVQPSSNFERYEIIKKILRNRGWLSLTEIAGFYGSSIGSKMLQRDLNALAEVGAIHTKGDRRWRKYQLLVLVENSTI